MLKKLLAIFLALLISFNLAGIFLVFKIQQSQIRHDIKMKLKQGVPDEELHKISFAFNALHLIDWVRKDKEFKYRNQMYDVVRKETDGKQVHFFCVNDTQETQLFVNLDAMVNSQTGEDSSHPSSGVTKKILKLLSLVYLPETSNETRFISCPAQKSCPAYSNNYRFFNCGKDIIPPEFI
jgi:hypothetical protein